MAHGDVRRYLAIITSILCAAFGLLSSPVSAQPIDSRPGFGDEAEHSFSIVLLQSGTKEMFFQGILGEQRILPPGRTRTAVRHKYNGPSPIVFYEKVTQPDGTIANRTLARAEFKNSMKEMLILVQPMDEEWTRSRTIVLDDSSRALPPDSLRALNMSLFPVLCEVNREQIGLKPNEDRTIELDTSSGMVNWRVAAQIEGEWRLVRASSTQFLEGMRQILVVNVDVSNPEAPALDIFSLYDRPRRQ